MLDKLYITPRQWLHILRWSLYSLLLLLAILVQTVVFGNHTLLGTHPNFVPVVIVCVCLREGPERGGLFALLASLFWHMSGADQGSVSIGVLTIVPVVGSLLTRDVLINRFVPGLIITLLALFLEQGIVFAMGVLFEDMAGILFFSDLIPCVLVSALAQPLVYWLVKRIEKIGDAYESI